MNNIWHDISPGRIREDDFAAVIEISKGSKNKYELDKETGHHSQGQGRVSKDVLLGASA